MHEWWAREQVNMKESFKNYLLTTTKYYLTHRMEYLVMWKNILPHVINEWFSWMKKMNDINKMDAISNEHWQQIKLHFPPSINFPNLYLKLHLFHLYYLAEYFLILPCLCIYSIFTTLYATDSHGHLTIVFLFNAT